MSNTSNTRSTLLDTYLSYHNLSMRPANGGEVVRDGSIFMPMLLMDAMYVVCNEWIEPLDLRHSEKKLRNNWFGNYNSFIKDFFRAFDEEQQGEICDIMDEFSEFISLHIERFRMVVMGKFMKYPLEVRNITSAALACNIFAQEAQYLWKKLHLGKNHYIAGVEVWSLKFLNAYADARCDRQESDLDLNQFQDINVATKAICNKIVEFSRGLRL